MQAFVTSTGRAGVWPRGRVGLRAIVRRHRFASYLAVAVAVSWSYWIAMALDGEVVRPGGTTTHFPGLFGPMVAAFAVAVLADGLPGVRDLVGRMFHWRTSLRWYALALVPTFVFVAGVGLLALTGGRIPTMAELARYSGLPEIGLPAVLLLAFLGNGFGEEVGWRGSAQPMLRASHGFLRSAAIVGAVWALWHVPSFGVIETYRLMGLSIIPIFVIGLGSGAIVFGWLYERSGGSILIVALAHLSLNIASATEAGRGLPQALVTTAIVAWAVLIVIAEMRRSGALRRGFAGVGRRMTTALLKSRAGRGLARSTTVITYRGRTTGRTLSTPVEYVRDGSRFTILVADPERKQWWRNVRADGEVRLLVEGVERTGRATVLDAPDAAHALAGYVAERPRSARAAAAGALAVVVELIDVRS
jgi:deazaflavin-dependent oxidoreductase (nitroreductase family)